jgi:hypothetical protein
MSFCDRGCKCCYKSRELLQIRVSILGVAQELDINEVACISHDSGVIPAMYNKSQIYENRGPDQQTWMDGVLLLSTTAPSQTSETEIFEQFVQKSLETFCDLFSLASTGLCLSETSREVYY